MTNLDPEQPLEIEAEINGFTGNSATGETLTAAKVDRVNSFDAPSVVAPKRITAKQQGNRLILTVEPKSITVLTIE